MADESKSDLINSVAGAIEKIGNSKWLNALLFGFGALFLYTGYEHRNDIFTTISSNPTIGFGVLGLLVLGGLGALFSSLQSRIYARYDDQLNALKADNVKLHLEIIECRADCRTEIKISMEDHRRDLTDTRAAIDRIERRLQGTAS